MSDGVHERSRRRETMKDISHTHPYTGQPFGDHLVFARGGKFAPDGGRPDAESETKTDVSEILADVNHTPSYDCEGANRVFERGYEGEP